MSQSTPKLPKVVLHVGSQKTGTTSIQFALSENRDYLSSFGVWYPRIDEFFPVDPRLPSARAHFAFAAAVAGFTKRDRKRIALFVRGIYERAGVCETVIISAESMYRHMATPLVAGREETAQEQRVRFVDRLAAVLCGFDVEAVLYLRRVDRFAESFYAESMVTSKSTQTFQQFLSTRRFRYDYRAQIDLFSAYFPLKLRGFEAAAEAGLIEGFCEDAGIPGDLPKVAERTRASVSNPAILWLRRAKIEAGMMENTERKRRWHFALLAENAEIFEEKRRTGFWISEAQRDIFVETYQSNVPEINFPAISGGIDPVATWSDAQHADAEHQFHTWQAANEEWLRLRERNRIPPFAPDA